MSIEHARTFPARQTTGNTLNKKYCTVRSDLGVATLAASQPKCASAGLNLLSRATLAPAPTKRVLAGARTSAPRRVVAAEAMTLPDVPVQRELALPA